MYHQFSLFIFLDEKTKKHVSKSDDFSSSDEDAPEKSNKTNEKDEIWKVNDVYQTSSSEDDDEDDDDSRGNSRKRRLRSR
jgi:hypothetical protein